MDNAVARGVAQVQGGTLSGTAIADYDYTSNWNFSDGTHSNNHPYDGTWNDYFDSSQVKPRGLLASYRINETSGNNLFDEFGALNAQFRGTPGRVNDTTLNSNVIQLDGSTQYAVLDRSLAELRDGTYALWVNSSSSTADRPLIYIGNGANSLQLVARDANGFAHLTITVNGVTQELASTLLVPLNTWTHLAITFNSGTATMYVNGVIAGSAAMSLRPNDVLTSDAYQSADAVYLGRNAGSNFFTGRLDDIRVYNVALTPLEIESEVRRSGSTLGSFYATVPTTFNGTSTTAESGVHSGFVRTFSAWIKPTASPSVTNTRFNVPYYTPIVDSTDQRDATGYGNGLGLNNGKYVVRLDNSLNIWDTGVPVSLGQWQQVTLTLSGTVANLYVNGTLRATRNYTASTVNGKNYRIGYGQTTEDVASRTYFNGQLFDLKISDRVIAPTTGLPVGWAAQDVQATGATGYSSFAGNTYAVTGAGTGVTGTSDRFQFAYTSLSGDGFIAALVSAPYGLSTTAVAGATGGLMLRTSVTSTVPEAMIAITPSNGLVFQYRSTSSGATTTAATLAGISGPVWLKLTRVGNNVSGYYSTNGSTFTQLGATITLANLGATTLAGLAVSSTVNATLVQGLFSNVSVTSSASPIIATSAAASATTVFGKTVDLSVLGASAAGESGLTYVWSLDGTPTAPLSFSANGSNAAKNTTVTFTAVGTYTFRVSVFNAAGQSVLSNVVTVTVAQGVGAITPAAPTVIAGTTQAFGLLDQFGNAFASAVTWTSSAGLISNSGLFFAPTSGNTATVTATAGSSSISAMVAVAQPRAWYKADATTGSTLTDSSTNGLNGSLTTTYTWGTGQIGNALTLGTGYATVPASVINGLTEFTISAWIKPAATTGWGRLFDFGTGTTKYMFLAPADGGGRVRFAITTGGGSTEQVVTSSVTLTNGTWSHVAITLSGTVATLYVNGVAVGTNTAVSLNPASLGTTTQNYLGKSQYPDPTFKGAIDDFRVYGTAASASTVAALYAAGGAYATSTPSSVAAIALAPRQVAVTWTDNSMAEVAYVIERATNAAFTAGLTSFSALPNTMSFTDNTAAANSSYFYRVNAVLAGGSMATSSSAPASTPAFAAITSAIHRYWTAPNELTFEFDKDVSANAFSTSSLSVECLSDETPIAVTGSTYDAATRSITFTLVATLPDGDYAATLSGGDWLPTDATLGFFVLSGDINHDRSVNFADLLILAAHYGQTGLTAAEGNLDLDPAGTVNFNDLLLLAAAYGHTLSALPNSHGASAALPSARENTEPGGQRIAEEVLR
ncbi:MAG: LamG domain-containing protein [Tepidisphaeraceae bacterium]